jgi:hypothetical protein
MHLRLPADLDTWLTDTSENLRMSKTQVVCRALERLQADLDDVANREDLPIGVPA